MTLSKNPVPYLDQRLYIKKDPDLGFGVYVRDFVKKGTIVEIAPVLFIENKLQEEKGIANYTFLWKGRKLAIGMGWSMYYNHSDDRNCTWGYGFENLLAIATIKDVNKNEQLTVSYGPNWFNSRKIEKINI